MRRALTAIALVAALPDRILHAAPIGPDNYDFAAFDPAVATHHAAHYGGWTQSLVDLDGDGRLDRMVHAIDAATLRTWTSRSNGDGTFAPASAWQATGGWLGWTFATADLDGDGAADIVLRTNDASGWRSAAFRSLGDGTFAPPVEASGAGAFAGWTSLLSDFTGDQRPDLLLCRADASGWHIALASGDGAGHFGAPVATVFPGHHGGWRLGTGDFDGDGRTDLSLDASDQTSWRAWVARSAGDGSFAAPVAWVAPGDHAGLAPARGDFDADGRTDLLLWASDATSWRARVARGGPDGFAAPVAWVAAPVGPGWTLSVADLNGDSGSDLVLQRAHAAGWQARVAIASGGGSFLPPRPWGALAQHFGGWTPAVGDFSGDGRADLVASAVDASGWRAHVALARGCDDVVGPDDDLDARLAEVPDGGPRWIVCLEPGLYAREILIGGRENLSLIAAHGDVTVASHSSAFGPFATPGLDAGAPIQIWQSHGVELDGLTIQNLLTYQLVTGPDGEPDQTLMVSRALEILDSTAIRVSNSHLVGPGKQLLHTDHADDVVVEESRLDCYYFCVDARFSTIELRRTTFRAEHVNPADDHALFWTDHSSQTYRDCTMDMVTGKSLFAGVNDFATDLLVLAGTTEVSPGAQAWVSQHANYNGINLEIRGVYPPLLDWYFIDWMGGGTQEESQICYDPELPSGTCVSP